MNLILEAKRLLAKTLPVLIGCALGAGTICLLNGTQSHAVADITQSPPREAFKSGGERAEAAVREVIDILKQMDRRLEKIETSLTKGGGATPLKAVPVKKK